MPKTKKYSPHSHGYRIDTMAKLQYEIAERLKEAPNPSTQVIKKMVDNWLLSNTDLGNQTRKTYAEENIRKLKEILVLKA